MHAYTLLSRTLTALRPMTTPTPTSKAHLAPAQGPDTGVLAPGLIRVLQQAVTLRFLLSLVSAGLLFAASTWFGRLPAGAIVTITAFSVVESAVLLGFVTWPALRRRLGAYFLPIALGWFLLAPLLSQALTFLSMPPDLQGRLPRLGLGDIFMESIWLAVPVMLAAWQYGRRGWQVAMAALIAGSAALGLFIPGDVFGWGEIVAMMLGRLGMVALLGYIVMSLVESLRAEHAALQAANRQLERRAVTAAQLAESRERNRLARELHDTLAHSLTGLSVQLQALETLLTHDPQAARTQLKEAQSTVRSGIQESRRAIQALRATPLEDLGLSEALRQLCRRQAERMAVTFTCAIDDLDVLDPVTEQSIYRVAEAALANVEQHAAASAVSVSLARPKAGRTLCLLIHDNGVGFYADTVGGEHYGLAGMRERAELIGATLTINSTAGQGTSVELMLGEAT